MTCTNTVTFHVARGYSYREIKIRCGRTDPYGGRAICDECADNADKMDEINRLESNIYPGRQRNFPCLRAW